MPWDPSADDRARLGFETCDRVLSLLAGRAEALVTCGQGRTGLTRFANSHIHQNMAGDDAHVRLRVIVDGGRTAQASTTRLDADGLRRLLDGTLAAARLRPPDPDDPGLAPPGRIAVVEHHDGPTEAADPTIRAAVVADFVSTGSGLESAGYCSTESDTHVLCSTTGARYASRATMAQLDAIHRAPAGAGPPTDGYGQATSTRVRDLDGRRVGEIAAAKARGGADPIELPPGSYEVVLEPRAVAAILLFPAWLGFNAKAHAEGTSFAHLGEQQFDERIDLWDDATDPRALGRPYDAEGTPKGRTDLVRAGVTVGLAHDRRSAALAGVEPTGHSVGSEAFGGYPGDLFLGGGDQQREDLVAGVERGLLVTDLWYNRVLDPKTQVVTGLTRNGLFLIEHGEVTRPVQNLRYTQSVVRALAPGHVLGLGDDAQLVGNEGGTVHVPSLRLASWAFTGNAQG
ncbi:MAG TPA: metallopeptidase TldD-related protein [Acidimicrobiales bacterium]|nr:metallopeptidase TldD-related protein [Acidimicrobiales bacterium]